MNIARSLKPFRTTYTRSKNAYFCANHVKNMAMHVFNKLGYNIIDVKIEIGGYKMSMYDEYDDEMYEEISDSFIYVTLDRNIKYTRHVNKILGNFEIKLLNKYGFKLWITNEMTDKMPYMIT